MHVSEAERDKGNLKLSLRMQDVSDELPPSSLYGGQHLLRLLVKLPELLPTQSPSVNSYRRLQQALTELIHYLQHNALQFFPASADRL